MEKHTEKHTKFIEAVQAMAGKLKGIKTSNLTEVIAASTLNGVGYTGPQLDNELEDLELFLNDEKFIKSLTYCAS